MSKTCCIKLFSSLGGKNLNFMCCIFFFSYEFYELAGEQNTGAEERKLEQHPEDHVLPVHQVTGMN